MSEQESLEQSQAPDSTTPQMGNAQEAPAAEVDIQTPQDPSETPAWTPDFKFKVMDKEHEIPEYLRAVVKDEDTLKMVRELHEKAYGLDHVKPKYETLKQQYEQLQPQFQAVSGDLQMLGQFLNPEAPDLGSAFKMLGLSDDVIFRYANERIEYMEASPDKQAMMDKNAQIRAEHAKYSLENMGFKEQQATQQQQQFEGSIESAVNSPMVVQIAQSFDQRAGKPNAFRDQVIMHGATLSRIAGRNLPVEDVIHNLITTYGLNATQASQPAAQAQVPAGSGQPAGARQQSLPKVNGTGAAPVKAKIRSMDDLFKARDAMDRANRS